MAHLVQCLLSMPEPRGSIQSTTLTKCSLYPNKGDVEVEGVRSSRSSSNCRLEASLGYQPGLTWNPVSKHKQVKTAVVAIHRAPKELGKLPSSTKVGDGESLNP